MATFTNQTKNSTVFQNLLARGKATILKDIEDLTFESVVFSDGTQLKDVTFSELIIQVWTLQTKNSTTYSNQSKS